MVKLKRFLEYLKVVINNYKPIAKGLIKSAISKNAPRLIIFWRSQKILAVFVSIVFAFLLCWPMFLANDFSNQNLNDFKILDTPLSSSEKLIKRPDVLREESADDLVCEPDILFYEKLKPKVVNPTSLCRATADKGKIAESDWKKIFDADDLPFDIEMINLEFSQMRYICSANWNRRVDVFCKINASFCEVSFEIVLDGQKYKMVFRSDVSAIGIDRISKMKVYAWKQNDEKIDLERKRDLVDKIIKARPKCSPFSSE